MDISFISTIRIHMYILCQLVQPGLTVSVSQWSPGSHFLSVHLPSRSKLLQSFWIICELIGEKNGRTIQKPGLGLVPRQIIICLRASHCEGNTSSCITGFTLIDNGLILSLILVITLAFRCRPCRFSGKDLQNYWQEWGKRLVLEMPLLKKKTTLWGE